jgi:hypothetical protein
MGGSMQSRNAVSKNTDAPVSAIHKSSPSTGRPGEAEPSVPQLPATVRGVPKNGAISEPLMENHYTARVSK